MLRCRLRQPRCCLGNARKTFLLFHAARGGILVRFGSIEVDRVERLGGVCRPGDSRNDDISQAALA